MRPLLIFLFLSFSLIATAQDTASAKDNHIYQVVDQMPEFPGGDSALTKFFHANIKYPDLERESGIQGIVVVEFVVDEEGNLSDMHIKKGVTKGIDHEALRVVKLFPKFKPGKQKGQPVKVNFIFPIRFKLEGQDDYNLTNSQYVIINRKAKSDADNINKLVPLGYLYQNILDVCKKYYTEIEVIKGGVLILDLSEKQKKSLKELYKAHKANLKAAMGDDLYSKYEAARAAQGDKDDD